MLRRLDKLQVSKQQKFYNLKQLRAIQHILLYQNNISFANPKMLRRMDNLEISQHLNFYLKTIGSQFRTFYCANVTSHSCFEDRIIQRFQASKY